MKIESTIQAVIAGFANIDRIDPDGPAYASLCNILDDASDDALRAVYEARVKFASKLALNRLIRRGLVA